MWRMGFLRQLFLKRNALPSNVPTLPAGQRIYAIGDIHGRLDLLNQMTSLITADLVLHPSSNPLVVFLGDYIDRGPESKEVVERLARRDFPVSFIALRGNHESILLQFLQNPHIGAMWLQNGGLETLYSYGLEVRSLRAGQRSFLEAERDFRSLLPAHHLAFFNECQLSFSAGDYFFCHAGVRPGVDLQAQPEEDLLWIREPFLRSDEDFGKVVVHGHTPVSQPEIHPNRINIDTGAYISGHLTALVIENASRRFLGT
jgi:serine/threonine protein phosphatase 1